MTNRPLIPLCANCGELPSQCVCNTPTVDEPVGDKSKFKDDTFSPDGKWEVSDEQYYTLRTVVGMIKAHKMLDVFINKPIGSIAMKSATTEEVIKLITNHNQRD